MNTTTRRIMTLGGHIGSALALTLLLGCFGISTKVSVAPPETGGDSTGGPPPLVVDTSAPLLLDEPEKPKTPDDFAAAHTAADNSPCFVCHVNYQAEPLAATHAANGVGCVTCHGESFAHRNDENNTTPPGHMYAADKIDEACGQCHRIHDAPAIKVIALWQQRCPEKTDPASIYCTDCHGEHRLKVRSVRWNKETGELIETNSK